MHLSPCERLLADIGRGRDDRAGGRRTASRASPSRLRSRGLFRRWPAGARPREFEASQAGAVWRFRNEGNRASFVAHPEIYGPQFGGYDPIDVARGVTVAGNPRFWLIVGAAALSVQPRGKPRRLCRRSGSACCASRTSAGRRWSRRWRNKFGRLRPQRAAVGSPQAMNAGTMKAFAPHAEAQAARPGIGDLAAGRGDDGMAGRDIPFAGRRKARIDIGAALRHPAEFDRRAQHLAGPRPACGR